MRCRLSTFMVCKISQRLLLCLLYVSSKSSAQPSLMYGRLEEYCLNNQLGEVTPQLVLAVPSPVLQKFGIRRNHAIHNFARMYDQGDEISDDICLSFNDTSLLNRLGSLSRSSPRNAFFMMLFGLRRLNFVPWQETSYHGGYPRR